jgi:hypothetical protein
VFLNIKTQITFFMCMWIPLEHFIAWKGFVR